MNIDKIGAALERVELAAVNADDVPGGAVISALADCERALKRILARANVRPGFERVEIVQAKGPTVEFSGLLLCETCFKTKAHDAVRIDLEIWETERGGMVAASYSTLVERDGRENAIVSVIQPSDDAWAMRAKVMDHFKWTDRARSMVRKLGWSIRQEVE